MHGNAVKEVELRIGGCALGLSVSDLRLSQTSEIY
jgi:hypothetical protein